jgi:hypothetical protein
MDCSSEYLPDAEAFFQKKTAVFVQVDFMIEHKTGRMPIRVKSASRPRPELANGLERFLEDGANGDVALFAK